MTEQLNETLGLISSELVREDASFADVVVQFVDGLGKRVAKMEESVRAGDFETLHAVAHQLKGCGGGFGYPVLTDRAASIEQAAKTQSIDTCLKAVEELKRICECVVVEDRQENVETRKRRNDETGSL